MSGGVIAIVVAVVVIVVVVAVVGTLVQSRRRSGQLEERFGPEYQREMERTGDKKEAERRLKERGDQRDQLDIRPLEPAARERYAEEWRRVQARFVDAPEEAVRESDRLVAEVMRERGYPVDDFDRRASDISVDHPQVAENYRSAHAIAQRTEQGQSSTEELRQATVHYRSLFEELLEQSVGGRGNGAGGGEGTTPQGGQPAANQHGHSGEQHAGGANHAAPEQQDRREEVR